MRKNAFEHVRRLVRIGFLENSYLIAVITKNHRHFLIAFGRKKRFSVPFALNLSYHCAPSNLTRITD